MTIKVVVVSIALTILAVLLVFNIAVVLVYLLESE